MAGQNVIVWEFESDLPGLFAPYQCDISNGVEQAYGKSPTEQHVKLGDLDHSLDAFEIDFTQMVQKNVLENDRRARQVRRQKYPITSVVGSGITWEWMTEYGWIVYDIEAIEAIERCYNQNKDQCDLQTLQYGLPNVVLLDKNYQRNKRSGFVRPVRRARVSYKCESTQNGGCGGARKRTNPMPNATSNINALTANTGGLNTGPIYANTGAMRSQHPNTRAANSVYAIPANTGAMTSAAAGANRIRPAPHNNGNTGKKLKNNKLSSSHMLYKFCGVASKVPDKEDCAICLSGLKEENESKAEMVFVLNVCKHQFHESCLEALYKQAHNQNNCLRCPICKQIHGMLVGDQPPGRFTHRIDLSQSVDGYEGDGMIVITYQIYPGVQGPEHPKPGRRYMTNAFPRVAYLPANTKGRTCLKLLEIAFDRRLIFTVGTSTTTGAEDCVTWTNIHHKTAPRGSAHGFPDPSYLDNLIDELKNVGVTVDDIKS